MEGCKVRAKKKYKKELGIMDGENEGVLTGGWEKKTERKMYLGSGMEQVREE